MIKELENKQRSTIIAKINEVLNKVNDLEIEQQLHKKALEVLK
jgi:hypothetical protein